MQEIDEAKRKYVEPPTYIKNHPLLFERYQQIMKCYMNPVPLEESQFVVEGDPREGELAKKMEEQIRKIVK